MYFVDCKKYSVFLNFTPYFHNCKKLLLNFEFYPLFSRAGVNYSFGKTLARALTEDTQTLLSIACNIFQGLADIYENDADHHYKTMLANMVGLMSDRASVMKSFDRQFDDQRKQLLNTEESLQFLQAKLVETMSMHLGTSRILAKFACSDTEIWHAVPWDRVVMRRLAVETHGRHFVSYNAIRPKLQRSQCSRGMSLRF